MAVQRAPAPKTRLASRVRATGLARLAAIAPFAVVLVGAGMVACSSDEGGGSPTSAEDGGGDRRADASPVDDAADEASADAGCPTALPRDCPSTVPSFTREVLPILQDRCFGCHTDGGVGTGTITFGNYAQVKSASHDIASQVLTCRMPLADAGQPSDDERAAIIGWILCGTPNN